MRKFRRIWDDAKRAWLEANKGVPRKLRYEFFLLEFPDAADVTFVAFCNEASRIGATMVKNPHRSKLARPVGSEQVKKGYVRIKVAQPNVWMSKAKWVYMKAHPDEDLSERSNYVFLDGNNRNFAPENIRRVPAKAMGLFNLMGGTEAGNPGATAARIAMAKLKLAQFDAGERLGLVRASEKGGRRFKDDVRAEARRHCKAVAADPERRAKRNAYVRAYLAEKSKDPDWKERRRKYQREWARKQREMKK